MSGTRAMALPASDAIDAAKALTTTLHQAGHTAWFAGGCVRDWLLGREPQDIDIATSAPPDTVLALFPGAKPIGKAFGVVQVREGERSFEVATFRVDHEYRDGRRPERVSFGTPEEDAMRRDFTINGMFYDPAKGELIDFVGGEEDLHRRRVRAIGDPRERFRDDALRLLRAVRFASVLEFPLEDRTEEVLRDLAPTITRISPERIRNELTRILVEAPRAGDALNRLRHTGLLAPLLPEVAAMAGVEQPPQFHPEGDVFTHTAIMLDLLGDHPSPLLAWSVLLHDVGKPPTAKVVRQPDGSERIRFDGHAAVGAEMARVILTRLRFSNQDTDIIVHCVAGHMRFMDVPRMREATLRRLVGGPWFELELELHRLDCLASHGDLSNRTLLLAFQDKVSREPVLPARWINGHDVMALGIAPGPDVGRWLECAYEAQLNGEQPDRDTLLAWLRQQIKTTNLH